MEDTPTKSDQQKQHAKEQVTKVFKNFLNKSCDNPNWINKYWMSYLKRDLGMSQEETPSQKDCLIAAANIVKHDIEPFIPLSWHPLPLWGEELDSLIDSEDESKLISRLSEVFWNLESLSLSFYPLVSPPLTHLNAPSMEVDYIRLHKLYSKLLASSESELFSKILTDSVVSIKEQLSHYNKHFYSRMSKSIVRLLAIWGVSETLYDPFYEPITSEIVEFFFELEGSKFWNREEAEKFFMNVDTDNFLTILHVNQQQMTFLMFDQPEADTEEQEKIRKYFLFIDFLYYSVRHRKKGKVALKEFHLDLLNKDWKKELPDFYLAWYDTRRGFNDEDDMDLDAPVRDLDLRKDKFLYVCYPWAFDAANKARLMNYEGQLSRRREMQNSFVNIFNLFGAGGLNFELFVEVGRDSLIEDALNTLVNAGKSLKKKLRVKFKGEPGVDEGGVQKEFFQLLIRELFDISYGMFDYNEESHLFWIKKDTFEPKMKFELIGIIFGLAIYNGNILDVHFPLAMYKKLLGHEVTLDDYSQYDPQVTKSLKALLDYNNDDFQEIMGLTFTVEYDSWGSKIVEELKENGKSIDVTNENKEEYIDLYVDFMMNKSIKEQFEAFKFGLEKCCGGEILSMIEPEDLEMLICGSKKLDFSELKKVTVYQDGYTENSPTVIDFWDVLMSFNEEEKKKFLFFCTGWDRAPINGLGDMRFFISKHGDNQALLPSVHTCFNHFLLPDYQNKEILREKLLKAINNAEGFGLL